MAAFRYLLQTPAPTDGAPAEPVSGYFSSAVESLRQNSGSWAREEAFWTITWFDLVLFGTVLLVAAVLDTVIRLLIQLRANRRRRDEQAREVRQVKPAAGAAPEEDAEQEARAETALWLDLVLAVSRAPLSLIIWVYAFYFGSFFLLREMRIQQPDHLLLQALEWLASLWGFIVLFWLIARIARVVDERLQRRAQHGASRAERILLPVVGRAARFVAPVVVVFSALPLFAVSPAAAAAVRTIASLGLIAAVTLLLIRITRALEAAVLAEFPVDTRDNLHARKVFTRVRVLRKMIVALLVVLAVASMLMVFEPVRQVGASMLASAGLAGIVIGFAAQRSLSTLVAGIQIALTQPIRQDDVVIVEGEWGRIEEITLTYVVVRIWDLRRLIVPINYFIETPFQNWTRSSADLLGAVYLYTDYSVPLAAIRAAVDRILEGNPRWDGKTKVVQVTDAKEHTIEVRILASAPDAGTAFDLRCEIREKLIVLIHQQYPESLPRFRAELKQAEARVGSRQKADAQENAGGA